MTKFPSTPVPFAFAAILLAGVSLGAKSVPAAGPTVVISEFLAINESGATDEDGDRSDWIELHNASTKSVNLAGWHLTDDSRDRRRWRLPAVDLPAGGYVVIFASDKDRSEVGKPLHTNFKLQGKGDYLALVGPDGTAASEFAPTYPDQKRDVSYGLTADGKPEYLLVPTPGSANATPREGKVAKVRLSHQRGLHAQPFKLELATATAGATIRFTTDGTAPTEGTGLPYSRPIEITGTTVIRVAAFKEGFAPSAAETHTFLFLDDVIHQSPDGLPPAGWPYLWGVNDVDYGMDPKVVNDPRFKRDAVPALKSLPSVSIVMNLDDLFEQKEGIYANSARDGRENERPCSVEYLLPDGGEGFQIDCGIRIRGGFSRMPMNPKHAFRLFFRKEYGAGKLKYPLFGDHGAREFDNLDLRTFQNYSWSFQADPRGIFLRDQFSRDLQLAMGQPAARGDYIHLYINGVYWGLYNTCERPEASYGASYFGGDPDDYDVIKVNSGVARGGSPGTFGTVTTDGDLKAWQELNDLARLGLADNARYQRLLGRNPDGSRNPELAVLLDPENLIDYMLVIFYGGNLDAPVTRFGGNARPNNWYGIRNRKGNDGFRFFVWDAEHTLLDVEEDRTGPFPAGNNLETSNPQWIWQQCLDNAEFRMLVADRIQRHFYNDGLLTAAKIADRFQARADQIELAVVGESMRWGDRQSGFSMGAPARLGKSGESISGPLNRDDDWKIEIGRVLTEYIPKRSDIVLAQLYSHGLVPDVPAPKHAVDSGRVMLTAALGHVYYTTDGTDPRQLGGDVGKSASRANGPIALATAHPLKARTRAGEDWSGLLELDLR